MQNIVSEAKRNRFSTIPTLNDEDIVTVWDGVADFIGKNLGQQKGVAIPSLGTFTFSQRRLDVGNNKYILIQRPVFQLSEKFAQTHALDTTKYHTDGQVPIVPLNFSALSAEMTFDRDTVEGCVKEMLQALSRSVQFKRNVEFNFNGIGKLLIRDFKVKMKFNREFLQSIDHSGNLVNALKNRPDTCDSVLSGRMTPFQRPSTSNTVVLPRINPGESINDQVENSNNNIGKKKLSPLNPNNRPLMNSIVEENPDTILDQHLENISLMPRSSSPMRLQTAPEKTPPNRGSSRLEAQPVQQATVTFKPSSPPDGVKQRTPPTPKTSMSPRKYLAKLASIDDDDNVKESDTFVPAKKSPIRSKAVDKTCSSCIHDAGQELCYLCYQRQRRNIPVYLHEERRKKEQEEDRLLQQYQHLKDYDAILKDQNTKAVNREEAQKIAAFNLGTSEAIKGKKNERPTDFHRSYIFHKRPVSPPFSLKQHKYNVDLEEQVVQKSNTEASARKNKDFMERLEQVELAKDLAAQREQYVRNKRLQSEEYRKALDTQVRFKPLPLPAAEPDSEAPVFGKFDMNYEKMTEKRIRARQLYEDQLKATAEKKRQAILSDLRNQKEESAMLSNARRDLLEESVYRNKEQVNLRRDLEDTWLQAAKSKQMREKEERRRAQSPGVLLHEQCSKYYHRCKECKRKLANSGESNVWSDSRYLSGSRIMV